MCRQCHLYDFINSSNQHCKEGWEAQGHGGGVTHSQLLGRRSQNPLCHCQRTPVDTKQAWLEYFWLGLLRKDTGSLTFCWMFYLSWSKHRRFYQVEKKGSAKECSNYCTIAVISHASKVMFKILQARLQQYKSRELPDVQAGFRKGRGIKDQTANICWIIEKSKKVTEKYLLLPYWLCQSLWLWGSQQIL